MHLSPSPNLMKGIIFTEFLAMVEQKFGYEMVDQLLVESTLESGGSYTAVGTYSFQEMTTLLGNLSKRTGSDQNELLHAFGGYIFHYFLTSYSSFFSSTKDAFEFLASIENHIHVEVLKLYPDAELPSFVIHRTGTEAMSMEYHSERKMGHFALGLIESSLHHYHDSSEIIMTDLSGDGQIIKFDLIR